MIRRNDSSRHTIQCDCSQVDCYLSFWFDRDIDYEIKFLNITIETAHPTKTNPLKRLWRALKYIFGRDVLFRDFHEMVVDRYSLNQFIIYLAEIENILIDLEIKNRLQNKLETNKEQP